MKRILSLICSTMLLAAGIPFGVAAAPALTAQTLDFAQMAGYYKTQGRVEVVDGALNMDTTSSGFEFYFYGSGDVVLKANVTCRYTTNMFLSVIVDGVTTRTELTTAATHAAEEKTITLASGLSEGYHHIEVYKQTEASSAFVTAKTITLTGTLMAAPPEDKITIEVVGDSISGGTSCMYSDTDADHPVYQDGTKSYAYVAGEALGANVRVTQTSGYGCCGGWNRNTDLNLQVMYPYTSYWRDHTDAGLYDFSPAADIVVINLGTNDLSAANYGVISLTNAQFKAGAKNLMTMASEKNNGAKVVWVTGMMGVTYETELTEAVAELGGAEAGYYFCTLPEGTSGGAGHPNVSEHAAAAEVLKTFLLENCLPAGYTSDFVTVDALQAKLTEAKAVSNPSAALQEAILWAEIEITCGTTDVYRLGYRLTALETAINGYVTGLDLLPVEGVTETPYNGVHYVWPYYGAADSVTLYKGGEGNGWPNTHTEYASVVDMDVTPYLTIDVDSTAGWNVHLAYLAGDGTRYTVAVSRVAELATTDFVADATRTTWTIDFGSYVKSLDHTDSEGRITIVGCDMYVVGETDTFVRFHTCAFTDNDGVNAPKSITGSYAVESGVLVDVPVGTTVDGLIAAMDHAEYLQGLNADGTAASGTIATGMKLQLVYEGELVQEVTVSVSGDVVADGALTSDDARAILHYAVAGNDSGLTAAQEQATDYDGNGKVNSTDVREVLLDLLNP